MVPRSYVLALSLIALAVARPRAAASAQSATARIDSLTRMLDDPHLDQRTSAVVGLRALAPGAIPPATRAKLYAMLERVADTIVPPPSENVDSPIGDLQMQLAGLVLSFRDAASIHALAIGGVEISGAIDDFLASQGRAAVPALEESLAHDPNRRSAVLSTFARMLKDYPATLPADVAARIHGEILASASADTLAFIFAADQGGLIEAVPVMQDLQRSRPALQSIPGLLAHLIRVRSATSPIGVLTALVSAHDAICHATLEPRRAACHSADRWLEDAATKLKAGRTGDAQAALREFVHAIDGAASARITDPSGARMLRGTAEYLIARMGDVKHRAVEVPPAH